MKQKDIMLLLIPSFIMVASWVIFNIYHSSVSSTISENLNTQISPISPTFDTKEIEDIKKRDQVNPVYEFKSSSSSENSQTEISSQSAQPIQSPQPNLNQQTSSPGGNITQ